MNTHEKKYYTMGYDDGWDIGLYWGMLIAFPIGMSVSGFMAWLFLN